MFRKNSIELFIIFYALLILLYMVCALLSHIHHVTVTPVM